VSPEFWHQRWQCGETGWHSAAINRHLADYWPGLGVAAGVPVLVPLCGKSLDMLWLASRGHRVLGVELSPIAVEAFFRENGLHPRVTDLAPLPFVRWAVDEIELLAGDFFDLTPELLQDHAGRGIGAVYDRAALIALPPARRSAYAACLGALLRTAGDPKTPPVSLLISLDYDQASMQGPPFAVTEAEVRGLFDQDFAVDALADFDALAENPRFAQRGLDRFREHIYRLRLRPQSPADAGS
jgi:thiopurine S-methyltransferase